MSATANTPLRSRLHEVQNQLQKLRLQQLQTVEVQRSAEIQSAVADEATRTLERKLSKHAAKSGDIAFAQQATDTASLHSSPTQHMPPRRRPSSSEFAGIVSRFRSSAAHDERLDTLEPSDFAERTRFLQFQDTLRPLAVDDGVVWPPPLLVDFGQLEVSVSDWTTSGIGLKESTKAELLVSSAPDAVRRVLREHSAVTQAIVGDESVIYIDNLRAKVPKLVTSSLCVGDELVTVGKVGEPEAVKFEHGQAVKTVEDMVMQSSDSDIELVFFRPLAKHIRRSQRPRARAHSTAGQQAATRAPDAHDVVRESENALQGVVDTAVQVEEEENVDGGVEASIGGTTESDDNESLDGDDRADAEVEEPRVDSGGGSFQDDVYQRNSMISFAVSVELLSVTSLALSTLSGTCPTCSIGTPQLANSGFIALNGFVFQNPCRSDVIRNLVQAEDRQHSNSTQRRPPSVQGLLVNCR